MRRSLQAVALLLGIAHAASAQTDDIQALKAEVKQLQERVNQLSSPPSASIGGVPSLPPVFLPNADPQLQADPSTFCLPSAACSKAEGSSVWPHSAYWKDGLQIKSSDD